VTVVTVVTVVTIRPAVFCGLRVLREVIRVAG
jgi:hypothetical protein